jgi:hypothetical protein
MPRPWSGFSKKQGRFRNLKPLKNDYSKSNHPLKGSKLQSRPGSCDVPTWASQGSSGDTDAPWENHSPFKAAERLLIG